MEGGLHMVTGTLQVKHDRYYAVINLKDEAGNRKQKWVNTGIDVKGSVREAKRFLAKELEKWENKRGVFCTDDFATYLEQWLDDIKDEIKPTTLRGYTNNMKNHVIPYFKAHKVALQDVTPIVLEDYYFSLLRPENNLTNGTALSTTSIRHHHQNISKALNDAVRRGLIIANPAAAAKLPKSQKFKAEFLNQEQLNRLVSLFAGKPVELPVYLCSVYGLRRSEVLGLKWKNVDFINESITICETLQQCNGGDYTDTTKTESSYRTLPMTAKVRDVLAMHRMRQKNNADLMGDYYVKSDYVCTHPNGEVITPNYLTRVFHSVVVKSDLPPVRLHDLRHSVASNLLSSGFSVVQVQEWLGHSSAATTLNFYAHVDKTSKKEIASAIDKADAKEKILFTRELNKYSGKTNNSETKIVPVHMAKNGVRVRKC